jgi:hypothetical protein
MKPEIINDIGCFFKVYRKTKSRKIISMSIWKSRPQYIYSLSNSLPWWADKGKYFFPDWNIRIYMDNSIFSTIQKNSHDEKERIRDIDWHDMIDQLLKHDNIELWIYSCEWGKKQQSFHIGTFGSIVRFHPMQDENVDIVLVKNLELLTSSKDVRLIYDWVNSGKTYYMIFLPDGSYICDYKNIELCRKMGMENEYMLMATFGIRKPIPYNNIFNNIHDLIFNNSVLQNYTYGVDEVILTLLFKNHINENNTYIVPVSHLEYIVRAQYKPIAKIIHEFFSRLPVDNDLEEIIKQIIFTDERYYQVPSVRDHRNLHGMLSMIYEKSPEASIAFIKFLNSKIKPSNVSNERLEMIHQDMMKFYIKMFKTNRNVLEEPDFIEQDQGNIELRTFICLKFMLMWYIDWVGKSFKVKDYDIYPSLGDEEVRADEILGQIQDEGIPNNAFNRNKVKKFLQEKKFIRNRNILLRNTKNLLLFQDTEYE